MARIWGCNQHYSAKDHVDVTITTSKNQLILPPSQFMKYNHQGGLLSKIPGYSSESPEIVLSFFSQPYPVLSGQQLRLWYGEDLKDYAESDNGGRVCCDVYALFV